MNKAHKYFFGKAQDIRFDKNKPVIINEFSLRVGNRLYPLDDISKCGVGFIIPSRIHGILLITLGLAFVALGIFKDNYLYTYIFNGNHLYTYIPTTTLNIYNKTFSLFELLEGIGTALCLLGLIWLASIRKVYVLQIVMGSEEMDIISSREKNQMTNIANVVNRELNKSQPVPSKKVRAYT